MIPPCSSMQRLKTGFQVQCMHGYLVVTQCRPILCCCSALGHGFLVATKLVQTTPHLWHCSASIPKPGAPLMQVHANLRLGYAGTAQAPTNLSSSCAPSCALEYPYLHIEMLVNVHSRLLGNPLSASFPPPSASVDPVCVHPKLLLYEVRLFPSNSSWSTVNRYTYRPGSKARDFLSFLFPFYCLLFNHGCSSKW